MGCSFQGMQGFTECAFDGCANQVPGTRPTLFANCRKGRPDNSKCLQKCIIENRLIRVLEGISVLR